MNHFWKKELQVKLQMNYELLKVQSCETNAPLYMISNGENADINEFSYGWHFWDISRKSELWFQCEETHKSFKIVPWNIKWFQELYFLT